MNSRAVREVELAGRALVHAQNVNDDMPAEEYAELSRIISTLGAMVDSYWGHVNQMRY